jgi:hypothetical protein
VLVKASKVLAQYLPIYVAWISYDHLLRCPSRKFSLMTSVTPRKHGIYNAFDLLGGLIMRKL